MNSRLQQHALGRLNFTGEVSVAQRLAACKTFLRLETAMIRMHHDAGESGRTIAKARSAMVDVMLSHLFRYAIESWERQQGPMPSPLCLVALGGYGREELCPLSDIDIMLLYSAKVKPLVMKPVLEHVINELLYVLWDCGLKVGHSTRTLDEIFEQARADNQTKTALLEARLICGSNKLYDIFHQAYHSFYLTDNPRGYILERLEDQKTRRTKHGGTPFLQEPDIKNGVGGLRDYQNTLWMAKVKMDIQDLSDLVELNYLQRSELRALRRAYDFLLRIRIELHHMSKRPTDLLDLATQPKLALHLGYTQHRVLRRVEQFMRDYYQAAKTIYHLSRVIEDRLALHLEEERSKISFRDALRAARNLRPRQIDGFIQRGASLSAEYDAVFRDDPVRLIRVFRHCQQLDIQPDIHLQSLIRHSLPQLTRRVIHSHDAQVSFRSILSSPGSVHPTLALMHELGVLGRFIPEFDKLTCLVQHELYHRYTADVHTLNAVRQLDIIFTEAEPITLKYRAAIHEIEEPELLYLTLLLHDIGKSEGIEGHAESGVRIAMPILERLGVSEEKRELVAFVIKNHLVMARFWQKRDVDDPKTAAAFAELMEDAERLRHLYVHTFCDARGTSSALWNGYKDTLHTSLYRHTLDHLNLGDQVHAKYRAKKTMIHQELITKKIPGISSDEITAHFNLLPERYFIHTEPEEISLHIQMVNRLLKTISQADSVGSLRPIIDWRDDLNRSLTVVNVITWDRAGLFYKLAGALSVAGLSILSARVLCRNDHIAIDTFYVVEPGRGVVQSATAQELFAKTVESALVGNRDLYPEIVAQHERYSPRYVSSSSKSAIELIKGSFPPSVDVYHELSMQRTIVEIQARDEIGLLYKLAKIIYDHGFDITFARIGTERGIAIDTFYIESTDKTVVKDTARLEALQQVLLTAISGTA